MALVLLRLLSLEQRQPASDQHMPCKRHVCYIRRSDLKLWRGFKGPPLPTTHRCPFILSFLFLLLLALFELFTALREEFPERA